MTFTSVILVNISRTGLLFVADSIPPVGVTVRIRFEAHRVTWVEASVVRVSRTVKGPHWIRVSFLEPCPGELIASVVEGRPGRVDTLGIEAALALLGMEWPCEMSDVKAAFRLRSKRLHPDVGGTIEGFLALREAFESLTLACQEGREHAPQSGNAPDVGLGSVLGPQDTGDGVAPGRRRRGRT
jgi:hypothetical protein